MPRTSRNNALRFGNLEQALAGHPETYRHIDLIAFGFPCQDISNANPKGKGLAGKRSSIFFECMRVVTILNPTWLFIENVPRLLSINGGRDFATVLQTISKSGYGYSWRILDSQYFGVPQRRKRIYIIGYFGNFCPPEILFEPPCGRRNDKEKQKVGQKGLCISTRDGERQDPTSETIIASTVGTGTNPDPRYGTHFVACPIQASDSKLRKFQFGENIIANNPKAGTITAKSYGDKGYPLQNEWNTVVAQTLNQGKMGNASFLWQDTYIAETNPDRKGKIAGIPNKLDSRRGIVIGNAVTVNVAEWIGRRIMEYCRE